MADDAESPVTPAAEAARLRAALPGALRDAPRLQYTLETLLGPLGLAPDFEVRPAPAADAAALSWPGRPGQTEVDLSRLRDAFAAISGERELNLPRDRLGRVSAAALGADVSRPVLSEWAREIGHALAALNPTWQPPEPRLTVFLTHDVDRVQLLEPMGMGGRVLRSAWGLARGDTVAVRHLLRWTRAAGRFLDLHDAVMRLEHDAGAVATYFFMSGPYSIGLYGARSGNGRRLRRMTEMVRGWGHRIGLHGCAHSLRRRDYGRQREALAHAAGGDVTWHRNHYLVFDAAQSPGLLAAGGLRVDSSCEFHDANGFRAGVAHPYRLWDRQAGGPSTVTEIPLIFMDNAFRAPLEAQWAQAYERIERAADVGGAVAVLLHVDRFLENEGCLQRYAGLLDWLKARGVDLTGGCPVADTGDRG